MRRLVAIVAWRELLDLSRDYKTILAVVLLPLVGMPGLALMTGALASKQQLKLVVIVEDEGDLGIITNIVDEIVDRARLFGLRVTPIVTTTALDSASGQPADILIKVPKGFSRNLTDLGSKARILISQLASSSASVNLMGVIDGVISDFSREVSIKRIKAISGLARLNVDPEAVREPVEVVRAYHGATGAPVSYEEVLKAYTAKILEFSLFFVVNPAVIFISDSIVGERERRTLEKLLVTPIPRRTLFMGKVIAGSLLGFIAAIMDGIAVVMYFKLLGVTISIDLGLVGVWISSMVIVILFTSSIAAYLASRSESMRSAQASSFMIIMAALAVYFSALMVDLTSLPTEVKALLYAIPFTHAALAIHSYVVGSATGIILHLSILLMLWVVFSLLASRSFSTERIILFKG